MALLFSVSLVLVRVRPAIVPDADSFPKNPTPKSHPPFSLSEVEGHA
jgi:hypothetical protein